MKKLQKYAAIAFGIFLLITAPATAGLLATEGIHLLGALGHAGVNLLNSIATSLGGK
jgi:hypothetical protein